MSGGPAFTLTLPAPGGSPGTEFVNLEEGAYALTGSVAPTLGTNPAAWSAVEVIQWLSYKEHRSFRDLFYANGFEGKQLVQLTVPSFGAVKNISLGDIKMLCRDIERLNREGWTNAG